MVHWRCQLRFATWLSKRGSALTVESGFCVLVYLLFLSKALLDMIPRSLGVREPCKRQEALKDI